MGCQFTEGQIIWHPDLFLCVKRYLDAVNVNSGTDERVSVVTELGVIQVRQFSRRIRNKKPDCATM